MEHLDWSWQHKLLYMAVVFALFGAMCEFVVWRAYRWLIKRCISYGLRSKADRCPLCGLIHS